LSRKSVYISPFKDSSKKFGLIMWLPTMPPDIQRPRVLNKNVYFAIRILHCPVIHVMLIYLSIITEISFIGK